METLFIVVPCYNEEDALPESARRLSEKLSALISSGKVSEDSRILFVDDGSQDSTWTLIRSLHESDPRFDGIRLSRNRGHQNAVMAGLVASFGDADFTITVDADLQDDIEVIDEMTDRRNAGADIVCGVRNNRDNDSFLKRLTAQGYYALMNLFGARIIYNHADFRMLSREAVKRLCCYGTEELFLRGLVTRLDLPTEKVYYARLPRTAGESKYTLKKMLRLAARGFSCGRLRAAETPQFGDLYISEVLYD